MAYPLFPVRITLNVKTFLPNHEIHMALLECGSSDYWRDLDNTTRHLYLGDKKEAARPHIAPI
jgi:hypothetical protein